MARDPRISMEQQAEESSVQFALTVDLSLVSLLVAIGTADQTAPLRARISYLTPDA